MFLMVEGGAIDWANHANQEGRNLEETLDFSAAVQTVVDWVNANSNWNETLLIVTADHECGALWGGPDGTQGQIINNGAGVIPTMTYNSGSHSNALVPLYVRGAGAGILADLVKGTDDFMGQYVSNYDSALGNQYIDNTDIYALMNHATVVPVPGAVWLLGAGLAGLLGLRRKA